MKEVSVRLILVSYATWRIMYRVLSYLPVPPVNGDIVTKQQLFSSKMSKNVFHLFYFTLLSPSHKLLYAQQQAVRVLDLVLDRDQKRDGFSAVNQAVVVR
jgi:hypothetical protein